MIATVRIAPVERWCDDVASTLKKWPGLARVVGEPLQLVVGKCGKTHCTVNGEEGEFKQFWVVNDSIERLHELAGEHPGNRYSGTICEHMLEMD